MGAGTRNEYRQELVGFANWCVRTRRLLNNPFAGRAQGRRPRLIADAKRPGLTETS